MEPALYAFFLDTLECERTSHRPRVRPGNLPGRHSRESGFVTFERKSVSRQEKRRYFRKYRDLLLF